MKRYRLISLILLSLTWGMLSINAQEGTATLDKVVAKFEQSKDVSASFTLTFYNAGGEPMSKQTGKIELSGNKFHWDTNEMEVWYDGKSQWTYVKAIEEVNLAEPTPEEVGAINPYFLVAHYKELFKAKALPSENAQEAIVELTPKEAGTNLDRIEVILNRSSWTPSGFKIYTSDRNCTEIAISKYTPGQNFPAETFVFDTKQYPQAILIDLR